MEISFKELGLNEWLYKQCHAMGLLKPTPIQVNCILPIIEGKPHFHSDLHQDNKFVYNHFEYPLSLTEGKKYYQCETHIKIKIEDVIASLLASTDSMFICLQYC